MHGQVGLRPAALLAQLANPDAHPFANITVHPSSVRCMLWANFAYRIQAFKPADRGRLATFVVCLSATVAYRIQMSRLG